MATILIVGEDGLAAAHAMRALRHAGHTSVLACDAPSAFLEIQAGPDLVLLDLDAPGVPVAAVVARLTHQSEAARTPLLCLAGRQQPAAPVSRHERRCAIRLLRKPVPAARLRRAVDAALAGPGPPDADVLAGERHRQLQLVLRLIVRGSDRLVFAVYDRLCADHTWHGSREAAGAGSWTDIADRGRQEGLLDRKEARLLRRIPLTGPPRVETGAA